MAGLTVDNPVTLTNAIISGRILPGDVLKLKAGTYSGIFDIHLMGTAALPIVFEPYGDGAVKIDGGIIGGYYFTKYLEFKGIEFLYSGWTTRTSEQAGPVPTDLPVENGITVTGDFINFTNCRAHDLSGFNHQGSGGNIIGCHIYNVGWLGTDRGHGHGIYSQNGVVLSSIPKNYGYNIIHDVGCYGTQIWDEHAYVDYYTLEHNISFNAGSWTEDPHAPMMIGSSGQLSQYNTIQNNYTHGSMPTQIGYKYSAYGMDNSSVLNNYFSNNIEKRLWGAGMTESGNTYGTVGNVVKVIARSTTIAHVAIYNEAGADTVVVDLTSISGIGIGDSVNCHNVQDYDDDVQVLTLDADKKITVNMQAVNRTICAPIGGAAAVSIFPVFGAFIIEKA